MFDIFQLFDDILKEEAAEKQQVAAAVKQDPASPVPKLDPEPTPQPVPVPDPEPTPEPEPEPIPTE